MCTILEQIFQLVYTEATMAHLDDAIDAGAEHKTDFPPCQLVNGYIDIL